MTALDNKTQIDAILLDFAKAFDKVPHKRLLSKLTSYGITGNTHNYGAPFSHLFTELKISPIELEISPIELKISAIELQISPIHLKISTIHFEISPNTSYLEISPINLKISSNR